VVTSHARADHLLVGQVELAAEESETPLPSEFQPLGELLRRIIAELGLSHRQQLDLYTQAGWVSARLTELLPLELSVKQQMLEIEDAHERLMKLREAIVSLHYL
jgi:Lon protease-like protein